VSPLPDNLEFLYSGEEFLRSQSLEAINNNEDLSRHVALIERAMGMLNMFSEKPEGQEADDAQTIRLLGIRLFNGCGAALRLLMSGYYQNAAMIMRDLLETVFLLSYLDHKPDQIGAWRAADKAARLKNFGPAKIRIALDERDGFKEKKREANYNLLCELAAHPTYMGFRMLAPRGRDHHCGPFFDFTALEALIGELVRLAIQGAQNYALFFKANSKTKLAAQIDYMEVVGQWAERYFNRPYNRAEIEGLKSILARMP
jgi:hypothetical protein